VAEVGDDAKGMCSATMPPLDLVGDGLVLGALDPGALWRALPGVDPDDDGPKSDGMR